MFVARVINETSLGLMYHAVRCKVIKLQRDPRENLLRIYDQYTVQTHGY